VSSAPPRPYGVVNPEAQAETARHVCVLRAWNGRFRGVSVVPANALAGLYQQRAEPGARAAAVSRLQNGLFSRVDVAEAVEQLKRLMESSQADPQFLQSRVQEADAFLRDWNRWTPAAATYLPQVGSASESIGWPSSAALMRLRHWRDALVAHMGAPAEWALAELEPPTARDTQGLIGAALDAYTGCVADAAIQLKVNHEQWEQTVRSQEPRAAAERGFLVRECRQGVARRDELLAERVRFEEQLAEEERALQSRRPAPELPTSSIELNSARCASAVTTSR